jgi:hypothetical protein
MSCSRRSTRPSTPGLGDQLRGLVVVGGRELEVDGARAALEQLELDLADAAADLEHGRARDALLLEELDHPRRGPSSPRLR